LFFIVSDATQLTSCRSSYILHVVLVVLEHSERGGESVSTSSVAYVPARGNFLGGWSDQEAWVGPAAVVNASLGWITEDGRGPYPIVLREGGKEAEFLHDGVGTGLGISSILAAAKYLLAKGNHDPLRTYIPHVLGWEREEGTRGGWQDQIGGIEPGVKLICGWSHRTFAIIHLPRPHWWDHLVLFDTGIRRPSRQIGQVVRQMMINREPSFITALEHNVADAMRVTEFNPFQFASACIEGWQRLCRLVPGMEVKPPNHGSPLIWGHMLFGAGGGGFGVEFVGDPRNRQKVVHELKEAGWWATVPILLHGIEIE